jgi:membrane protein implicated in regulation of membrane protease activity
MALIAGLAGGVALTAIGRFTAVSVAGLGLVVVLAWRLDRRRHSHDRREETNDRFRRLEGTVR